MQRRFDRAAVLRAGLGSVRTLECAELRRQHVLPDIAEPWRIHGGLHTPVKMAGRRSKVAFAQGVDDVGRSRHARVRRGLCHDGPAHQTRARDQAHPAHRFLPGKVGCPKDATVPVANLGQTVASLQVPFTR
ncbi:hypothetical protein CA260_14930 [Dyella jiangningensis]|uniref:Uncharacterized protein n=1 Tax=Dyella jiangningensis TaxID=1379159 RepID=A0A328P357_9GAMM|nr:hypothetical protein CA260_14930 [Dyella jiangningensis]